MERIQQFWLDQTAAEYASSAITVHYVHSLQRVGASPDLIKQGLKIADDEMNHANLAYAIALDAGTNQAPKINDPMLLIDTSYNDLRKSLFKHNLRFYCLGETVAIPLFKAMSNQVSEPKILSTFTTILKDEGRHSEYGWMNLAWMDENWQETRVWLAELLPECLSYMKKAYRMDSEYTPKLTDKEKAWGMLAKKDYGSILSNTISTLYDKRLSPYDIDISNVP